MWSKALSRPDCKSATEPGEGLTWCVLSRSNWRAFQRTWEHLVSCSAIAGLFGSFSTTTTDLFSGKTSLVLFSSPEQEFGFSSGSKPGEPLSLRMNGGWQGSARCHVGPAARFRSRCTVISFPGSRALPLLRAAQRSLFSHQRLRSRCCRGHSYAAFLVLCCLGREPEPFRLLSMCAVAGHSRASYFQRFCSFLRL